MLGAGRRALFRRPGQQVGQAHRLAHPRRTVRAQQQLHGLLLARAQVSQGQRGPPQLIVWAACRGNTGGTWMLLQLQCQPWHKLCRDQDSGAEVLGVNIQMHARPAAPT